MTTKTVALAAVAALFTGMATPSAQTAQTPAPAPASVTKRPVPRPAPNLPKPPLTPPSPAAPVAPGDISLTPAVKPWTGLRTPDGQPDVHGAYARNWIGSLGPTLDLEDGIDEEGFAAGFGAGARSTAPQIVRTSDGKIPYQPWARAFRIENRNNVFNPTELRHIDPVGRCLPMGVPREALDQGWEIVQTKDLILFNYGYNQWTRQVYLDGRPPLSDNVKLWYGDAIGKWEGNSLVIESRNHNAAAWLDSYGNYHSSALKLHERYVFDGDRVYYDAILEDPKVFTRPWTAHNEFAKGRNAPQEQWETACYEGERNVPMKLGK